MPAQAKIPILTLTSSFQDQLRNIHNNSEKFQNDKLSIHGTLEHDNEIKFELIHNSDMPLRRDIQAQDTKASSRLVTFPFQITLDRLLDNQYKVIYTKSGVTAIKKLQETWR